MRVYHFLPLMFALQNLERKRLKISEIGTANDPFEFLSAFQKKTERLAFAEFRRALAARSGMICFSQNWESPVQWAHYADNHRGLCLGFDVPKAEVMKVDYVSERISLDLNKLSSSDETVGQAEVLRLMRGKFEHWHYEQEVRMFSDIRERDPVTGLAFVPIKRPLQLREVIIGARSDLKNARLESILRPYSGSIKITRARPAFHEFKMVEQRQKRSQNRPQI